MTPAWLVAFLPRGDGLTEKARIRFEQTSLALGHAARTFDSGALFALGGPATLGPGRAIVGQVYAPAGMPEPSLAAESRDPGTDDRDSFDPQHWGDYLALASTSAPGHRIDRSPFGTLPCFWIEEETHVVAATSVALLEAYASAPLTVDSRQLAMFLLAPQMRNGSTCLGGVRELVAGNTLLVGGGRTTLRPRWSPWAFACTSRAIDSPLEASETVGAAIDLAIAARCGSLENPVLLLSGGLDSSTIASSLALGDQRFHALTMVTRHRSGDERSYARAVADATGAPLSECLRSTGDVDLDDPTPRRLVRPSARLFRQPTLRAAQRLAKEKGGDTIIDGGGGDDLFCSLNSVVPLLDRLAIEGPGRGSWQTAREIALRADVDLAAVLGNAARRLISRRVAYRWSTVNDFLTRDALTLAGRAVEHSWLVPPRGALPGQAAHVALILDALSHSEDDSLDPAMRTISPLVAQPVVEAALRVRSWLWFEEGRNRAVIRRALADRLPHSVTMRSGKGTPGGFVAELVEDHRSRLRELLLDGMLVAQGIADPVAIEAVFADHATLRGDRYGHLLVLADAERWARLWS